MEQYEEDSAPCLDTSVQMKMDFDNLKLEYAIFKYSLNGTFLGSEEVNKIHAVSSSSDEWVNVDNINLVYSGGYFFQLLHSQCS